MAASILSGGEYQFLGKHFIASYSGCNKAALKDVERLEKVMNEAVAQTGATSLNSVKHIFPPDGFTMVILLGESHASIHTYPEHGSCFVDLFTCGDHCNSEMFDKYLREYLQPTTVNQKIFIRHEGSIE
jgi:S-adenosylmethionine decarboxylase